MPKKQPQPMTEAIQPNGENAASIMTLGEFEWYEVTTTGIVFQNGAPEEVWMDTIQKGLAMFESSRDLHLRAMFMVGDCLAYGERAYGERYSQAIDNTRKSLRLSFKTLQNAAWICGSVPPENRHELLTFSHHEAVARLTDLKEQADFLTEAEEKEWSVAELKMQVKKKHPPTKMAGPAKRAIIDLDSEEGLLHAAEKIVEFFSKDEVKIEDWTKERQNAWVPTIVRLCDTFGAAEDLCREILRVAAAYLDNPDNNPLKEWSDGKKKRWTEPLNNVAKAGRRMGVIGAAKPTVRNEGEPEPGVDGEAQAGEE